jgi:hypothetical protein
MNGLFPQRAVSESRLTVLKVARKLEQALPEVLVRL